MRLKHIKLAGFKSFVDPTKVAFPEQMTCIVGPNGCGKSNVIDAVRWVLGESSAKNLRGDAMTDVIFNGSQSRKPVSQASVELVFDNSSGRVQGEFASFNEISVKRVVTRDAQSTYLLNGAKCRRRDITDLFLGTGLGPRSYAIIEQGMISRLIESRPQELRVFIEEAAGISKYKERRKETESRMNRTRDNLERLLDVREELGQQLAKLQRQAAAARRFQTLKAEERTLKAELQALRWVHYQTQCDRLEQQVQKEEAELQKWVAEQRGSERGQTELREREADLKMHVDEIQQSFYEVNTQITRLEQQIQHARELQGQRERQGHEYQAQQQQLQAQAEEDEALLVFIAEQIAEHAQQMQEVAEQLQMAALAREEAEFAYETWQAEIQGAKDQHAEHMRTIALRETEAQSAAELSARVRERLAAIAEEYKELPPPDTSHCDQLAAQLAEQDILLRQCAEQLQCKKDELEAAESQLQAKQDQQKQAQMESGQLQGRIDSFNDLLQSTLEVPDSAADIWLSDKTPIGLLREFLQVPEPFRSAVELLLNPWLTVPVYAESLPARSLQASAVSVQSSLGSAGVKQTLADFADPAIARLPLLGRFGYAEDTEQAIALCVAEPQLLAVALPGGVIRARDWVLQVRSSQSQLDWQAERDALQAKQAILSDLLAQLAVQVEEAQSQIIVARAALDASQTTHQEAYRLHVQLQERLQTAERDQAQQQTRRLRLQQEQSDLDMQSLELLERQQLATDAIAALHAQVENDIPALEAAQRQGETLQSARQQAAHAYQLLQKQQHEQQLQDAQLKSKQDNTNQNRQRIQQQCAELAQRLSELQDSDEAREDVALLEETLAEQLLQRESVEEALRTMREQLATVSGELAILNQGQSAVLEQIAKQQERVQSGKMELAAARERGHALLDSFNDMRVNLKTILENMPDDADEKVWQARIEDISRKVGQLGAINLAALEEVEVQAERKAYLDAQHEDLSASLQTLEDAMKKIDRETRQRFKTTFEQVNADLQQLFPKVFGGGHAYLDLTDDNLLETGVTIMARPPGKKNSTIHLLSGGEKALTALALVFAIFRLNPAPFCLLDEVDAPLDDINVGRFCRLVSDMSENVQFIYISHNKIAMEMATHLSGVTMQEPGVSRLVAVDVEEALALAEA